MKKEHTVCFCLLCQPQLLETHRWLLTEQDLIFFISRVCVSSMFQSFLKCGSKNLLPRDPHNPQCGWALIEMETLAQCHEEYLQVFDQLNDSCVV